MKKLIKIILKRILSLSPETWTVLLLLIVASVAHGLHMFNYPYFENDEATYVSQAWSFVHSGKLAPYTYYYDHAPAGWILLGLWFLITGGLTTFGHNPLVSGRIFIFILHMVSVLLLYVITKRVTRQKLAAVLAVLIFSLSPLELYYGRRVLLDNIMVFWILFSLFFATGTKKRLGNIIFSAITFAIAVLSKENALFMAPAILYIVWIYSSTRIRTWAIIQWIVISTMLISLYPLYALLKGEFFSGGNHVSLIQTVLLQGSRGTNALPWNSNSEFYTNLQVWLNRDPWIIIAGSVSLLTAMVLNERYREIKAIALTAIAQILFFARGKLVIDFYILAVIPLLAIMIGIIISRPVLWAKSHISPWGYGFTICFLVALIFVSSGTLAFSKDETSNQQKAIAWIEQHVPKDAMLIIDNYAYPQLHDVDGYKNADFSFKAQYDPMVQKGKYNADSRKIQYLLITHAEIQQMASGTFSFVKKAFDQSELVADYRQNTTSYLDIDKLISTNGDWAQVYKVDSARAGVLVESWRKVKQTFLKDSGQIIDLTQWTTTSENQANAMLRALTMNDKVAFDVIWKWTKENMQVRGTDALLSWKITLDERGFNHLADTSSLANADEDSAFALLLAYRKWGDTHYLHDAKKIVTDLWKNEVKERNGILYLVSTRETLMSERKLLVNPSYLAPFQYTAFAQIDPAHNWQKLTTDSYSLLDKLQSQSKAGLISNWVAIEPNGDTATASRFIVQSADTFGDDAAKINQRMADDIQDPRARNILQKLDAFYQSQWTTTGMISSEYDLDGKPLSENSDLSTDAGAIIGLHALQQDLADTLYRSDILPQFHPQGIYWGRQKDYINQSSPALAIQYLAQGGKGI